MESKISKTIKISVIILNFLCMLLNVQEIDKAGVPCKYHAEMCSHQGLPILHNIPVTVKMMTKSAGHTQRQYNPKYTKI